MAKRYHDELAEVIVKGIVEARNRQEYRNLASELVAISNAYKCAEGRSRLECDLKRFTKKEPDYYDEKDIEVIMQDLSSRIGKEVHFRTIILFDCIKNRLVKELSKLQDQWQTAKIIYALGTLYDDSKEAVSKIVYSLKDDEQRRLATICTRVYFKGFEDVFIIFSPDAKI